MTGPAHMSVTRQAIDFLYVHSDAFLNGEEVPLSGVLITFLNRGACVDNRVPIRIRCLTEWIAAETSLIELFALALRGSGGVGTNVDE